MREFEYVIVGAGIAGCSVSHFLSKYSKSVLLIDKNEDVAFGASGAAGAFLSPLLGKPNKFKDLVTKALNFSYLFIRKISLLILQVVVLVESQKTKKMKKNLKVIFLIWILNMKNLKMDICFLLEAL